MLFNKVTRCLLCWDRDEWHTLVSRLEPNNLWFVRLSILLVTVRATIAVLTLGLLFLFCGLTAGPQESKSAALC